MYLILSGDSTFKVGPYKSVKFTTRHIIADGQIVADTFVNYVEEISYFWHVTGGFIEIYEIEIQEN